jgi:ribosomal protein S18 acetylase RimI-like enzyme
LAETSHQKALRTDAAEIARLEDLSRKGWPALEIDDEEIEGWVLGTSGAYTRRANSVAPVASPGLPLDQCVGRAEAFYAERGRPAVFKLHSAAQPEELDAFLDARGYFRMSETVVMTLDLETSGSTRDSADDQVAAAEIKIVEDCVDPAWFDASVNLSEVGAERHHDYRSILEKVVSSTPASIFGRLEREEKILSLALGYVVGGAVSFVQVATAPAARGQRLAGSVLNAILAAASERGAHFGLLSVEATNTSARRLYDRLGFIERYRYWYREQGTGASG